MENFETLICGTLERVKWHKKELLKYIEHCISAEEIKLAVGWYLLYGTSNGLKKQIKRVKIVKA